MLGTMGGNSRRGDISLIYKKGDKEGIRNYRPIAQLNLDYNICTSGRKLYMQ